MPKYRFTWDAFIVSGRYCVVSQLTPDDDIMLCSVASLARHKAVVQDILSDPSIFLVIDEAHHAPAKSYRDIIKYMKESSSGILWNAITWLVR